MLSNCRIACWKGLRYLTVALELRSFLMVFVSDCLWYMLFYPVLQSLICAAYVPAIIAAHVLMYDHTLLLGRHNIFTDCWKYLPCSTNYARFDSTKAIVDSNYALLFKFKLNICNHRYFEVNWVFLRTISS